MTDQETESQDRETVPYTVTTTSVVEIDFTPEERDAILAQTGADDVESAIEAVVTRNEMENVEPAEKLVALEVTVDGPSDD